MWSLGYPLKTKTWKQVTVPYQWAQRSFHAHLILILWAPENLQHLLLVQIKHTVMNGRKHFLFCERNHTSFVFFKSRLEHLQNLDSAFRRILIEGIFQTFNRFIRKRGETWISNVDCSFSWNFLQIKTTLINDGSNEFSFNFFSINRINIENRSESISFEGSN